jgi:ABC-2 type transport system ATP-binding protein
MLTIKNLEFGYPKSGLLFDKLGLDITKGNIYGLLGKNGAGKTTLLKIMCGLLYSQKGEIEIEGENVAKRLPSVLQDIYLIPEEFYLPDFSIETYVEKVSPFYPKFDHKQFKELISEFDVTNGKKLSTLSHGQKKKFIISFSIATNCSLVFMDEPTNGLDIPSKSKFRKIIASTANEERTFIISTHQVRDLENLIDPLVIIESGKIIFQESIENISSKLDFMKVTDSAPAGVNVLYSEAIFGGNYLLTEKTDNLESNVDFELLFNAVLSNQEDIVKHLKN